MTMMEVLWENLCTVLRAITCNRSSGSIEDQICSIGHLKILDEHYLPSSFGWSFSFIYERLNSSDLYVKMNSTWNTRNTWFSKIIPWCQLCLGSGVGSVSWESLPDIDFKSLPTHHLINTSRLKFQEKENSKHKEGFWDLNLYFTYVGRKRSIVKIRKSVILIQVPNILLVKSQTGKQDFILTRLTKRCILLLAVNGKMISFGKDFSAERASS